MSFQFRCPQGHVLQGELSQVGHLFQCPMCGSNFLIPPPTVDPAAMGGQVAPGGFFQMPGAWPGTNAPGPSFPGDHEYTVPGPMPGMMPPQTMPMMPGGQMSGGPMPGGPYPMPAGQPFAFGPVPVNPPAQNPATPPAAPAETSQQAPAAAPQSETGKPHFDLGFDPNAKASLPFEIPGQSEAEAGSAAAPPLPAPSFPGSPFPVTSFPAASFPPPSFPGGPPPAADFPAPATPAPTMESSADGQEFLPSAPAATEDTAALQDPPKILHIRCPSGHLVKAKSDLLGKNGRCPACKKTFELRYEDSVEFLRRKEKILHREDIKTNRAWLAWAFLATFIVFAGLVALMLALSR